MTQAMIPNWLPAWKHGQVCLIPETQLQANEPHPQVNTSFPRVPPGCPVIELFAFICAEERTFSTLQVSN